MSTYEEAVKKSKHWREITAEEREYFDKQVADGKMFSTRHPSPEELAKVAKLWSPEEEWALMEAAIIAARKEGIVIEE